MDKKTRHLIATLFATLSLGLASSCANAALIYWTDWTGGDMDPGVGFQGQGTITTNTSTVTVTYTNPQGIAFYQSSPSTYYYTGGDSSTSPYTSAAVDNAPDTSDIIALTYVGMQTLHFSQTIANPVFAYVSLNSNGYAFNRDFDILSFGDGSDGNACGYWGCGTSYKEVVDLGSGNIEYRLLGTGEPHGAIQFRGAFDSVTWRSMTYENWNGFTLGVQGTADEVFNIPEPAMFTLLGLGISALSLMRRRRN